jgi:hypothetical protein
VGRRIEWTGRDLAGQLLYRASDSTVISRYEELSATPENLAALHG